MVVSCEHSIDLLVESQRSLQLFGLLSLVLLQFLFEGLHVGIRLCDHLDGELQLKISLLFHLHQRGDVVHVQFEAFLLADVIEFGKTHLIR